MRAKKVDSTEKPGLYANIHAKQQRIAKGSRKTMRKKAPRARRTRKPFRRQLSLLFGKSVHTDVIRVFQRSPMLLC